MQPTHRRGVTGGWIAIRAVLVMVVVIAGSWPTAPPAMLPDPSSMPGQATHATRVGRHWPGSPAGEAGERVDETTLRGVQPTGLDGTVKLLGHPLGLVRTHHHRYPGVAGDHEERLVVRDTAVRCSVGREQANSGVALR